MSVTVRFKSNMANVLAQVDGSAKGRMLQAVIEVRNETLETLSGQRTGRIYRVPDTKGKHRGKRGRFIGKRRTYQASSPGETPAQATAGLRQSIIGKARTEAKVVIGEVGTDMPYGPRLEFGFSDVDSLGRRYNMAARPWLKPSFEKALPKVAKILGGTWL